MDWWMDTGIKRTVWRHLFTRHSAEHAVSSLKDLSHYHRALSYDRPSSTSLSDSGFFLIGFQHALFFIRHKTLFDGEVKSLSASIATDRIGYCLTLPLQLAVVVVVVVVVMMMMMMIMIMIKADLTSEMNESVEVSESHISYVVHSEICT